VNNDGSGITYILREAGTDPRRIALTALAGIAAEYRARGGLVPDTGISIELLAARLRRDRTKTGLDVAQFLLARK
jgi:hypothetical protein